LHVPPVTWIPGGPTDLIGDPSTGLSFLDRTGPRTYERGVRLPLVCVLCALPRLAAAEIWVTADGEPPRTQVRNVILVPENGAQTLIQSWVIEGAEGPFIHLEGFPSPPELSAFVPRLGPELARVCRAPEPLHLAVQRRPLGPSLAGLLLPTPRPPPEPPSEPSAKPLSPLTRRVVTGPVRSSTVARGGFVWPEVLQDLLARRGLEASIPVIRRVAQQLNGGGTVVATLYAADAPGPHRLGPVRSRFEVSAPELPVLHPSPGERLELVTVGASAWRPRDLPVEWAESPWRPQAPEAERWRADCALRLEEAARRTFAEALNTEADVLVRWRWAPPSTTRGAIALVADEMEPVPNRGSGTFGDLWRLWILALLPLFLAPEAWALAWMQSSLQRRIWTAWPVAVALYWLWVLPGWAKSAALGPALAALVHASWPSEAARRPFHRAPLPRPRSGVSRTS